MPATQLNIASYDRNARNEISDNTFELTSDPSPTEGHTRYRGIGPTLQGAIEAGRNTFDGM